MTPLYTLAVDGVTVNLYPDLSYDMGEIDPRAIRAYAALAGDTESGLEEFIRQHAWRPESAIVRLLCHVALPMWEYREVQLASLSDSDMGSRFLYLRVARSTGHLLVGYRRLWFTHMYGSGNAFAATPFDVGEGYAPQCPLRVSYAPRSVAVPYKGKHGWGVAVERERGVQ